jgi:SAM-dependent methyltransferase
MVGDATAVVWRLKLLTARARRRLAGTQPNREDVVRRHAAGKTFCDVGCMWKVNGRIAFIAEEAGATAVTGIDVMPATPEFEAERERRSSNVQFVRGDVHDPETIATAGPHEVVWCSGLLYHAPNPVLTLQRLRNLTTELLILQTMTLPELPGVKQGLVFYPGVPNPRLYARWGEEAARSLRLPEPGEDPYAPWWWGISRSALAAMLRAANFEPVEQWGDPFAVHVLARPV